MEIIYAPRALNELSAFPLSAQERIVKKIEFYATQPDPLQFAKRLQTYPAYRFRIGAYRVIFKIVGAELHILKIGTRSKIYEDL